MTGSQATPAAARVDRRSEIVRVAYQLIAERGLEGLRFADVAKAAGINNGTLLYYFASKDALIEAVANSMLEQFSQSAPPREPDGLMTALVELQWEFLDAQQHLHNKVGVVYTELVARAQRDPAVARLLQTIDNGWHNWLVSILELGRSMGQFRHDLDSDVTATAIMAAIRGVGTQALISQDPDAAEKVMQTLAQAIECWVVEDLPAKDRRE